MFLRHIFDTIIMTVIIVIFNIEIVSFVGHMNGALSKADLLYSLNNGGISFWSEEY